LPKNDVLIEIPEFSTNDWWSGLIVRTHFQSRAGNIVPVAIGRILETNEVSANHVIAVEEHEIQNLNITFQEVRTYIDALIADKNILVLYYEIVSEINRENKRIGKEGGVVIFIVGDKLIRLIFNVEVFLWPEYGEGIINIFRNGLTPEVFNDGPNCYFVQWN